MLFTSIIFLLLSNATTTRRDLALMFNRSLTTVLFLALIISINSNNYLVLKEGVSLFSGLFHNTSLTVIFHAFVILVSIIIIQLTAFLPRKYEHNATSKRAKSVMYSIQLSDKAKEQYTIIEYPLVILFVITGAVLLISSSDVVSIFLSIELQSYGLYLLCTLYRNSESSTGAGLTYFLLGGLSSCFILLACGILYTNSGTTNLNGYYLLADIDMNSMSTASLAWYNNNYLNYSLVILSIGFLFKISAAPFHFWSPDVYDAIPTVVTTFVANIAKISILIFLVEIIHFTSNLVISNFNWTNSLLLSSLLSLIVGTVLGLNQSRIKKLLAYSTISHLGFMLLAISVDSIESTQAFIFYLMQYSISNVNMFIIIISIGYVLYSYDRKEKENKSLVDEENSPVQFIAQLKGFFYINPALAISFIIVIYSFVGIPPLVGFFGKQMVLSSALDKGYIFISLVAILTSVISAVYYLNLVKEIFFSKSDYILTLKTQRKSIHHETMDNKTITNLSSNLSITISVLTLIILLFMVNPEQWLSMSNILAVLMFS